MAIHTTCLAVMRQAVGRHRAGVELHARVAVAFDLAFHPHEDLGVHGLRAGVAAPQPPGHGGEEEQRIGAEQQQRREVDEVLRVKTRPKM
jgi:hypothetical protein